MAWDFSFDKVSLLLHLDGTNGSTTITDLSGTPKSFSAVSCSISTANSKFGGASLLLTAPDSYASYGSVHADFTFSNVDFTVECFYMPTASPQSNGNVLEPAWGAVALRHKSGDNKAYFDVSFDGGGSYPVSIPSLSALSLNTFYHLAGVRSGNTFMFFVDGQLMGSVVNSSTIPIYSSGSFIGGYSSGKFITGHIDEVRVTKGMARYTNNFTPPDTEFGNALPPSFIKRIYRPHFQKKSTNLPFRHLGI